MVELNQLISLQQQEAKVGNLTRCRLWLGFLVYTLIFLWKQITNKLQGTRPKLPVAKQSINQENNGSDDKTFNTVYSEKLRHKQLTCILAINRMQSLLPNLLKSYILWALTKKQRRIYQLGNRTRSHWPFDLEPDAQLTELCRQIFSRWYSGLGSNSQLE